MSQVLAIDEDRLRELIHGIHIPPQPVTLSEIQREAAKPEPSLRAIGEIVSRDIGVSASTLKVINSPFFGLRREVDSVQQAVSLLGIYNIQNIVSGVALRASMEGNASPSMDRFFDSANDSALVCAALAKELCYLPADVAYTLGLFHDCGIPLMMLKHPGYKEVLDKANRTDDRDITEVEDEFFGTNHTVVGYFVSKSWKLPAAISEAIINHHRVSQLLEADRLSGPAAPEERKLTGMVALVAMAEHISYVFRERMDHHDWEDISPDILAFFDLQESEYQRIEGEMLALLAEC